MPPNLFKGKLQLVWLAKQNLQTPFAPKMNIKTLFAQLKLRRR